MKAIAVFSLKGGVGKSAIAVNLAHQAATVGGRRTLLWDLDVQGAATWLLRLQPRRDVKARAALGGEAPLGDLVLDSQFPGLAVLPADRSLRRLEGDLAQDDSPKLLRRHLKSLEAEYDRVILDCPPGLSELAERLFRAVDLVVAPALPSPLSERMLAQLGEELAKVPKGGPPLLPVWSMVDRRRKLHRETVAKAPDWPTIPYAAAIETMAVHQAPIGAVAPSSEAARAFAALWARVERALVGQA